MEVLKKSMFVLVKTEDQVKQLNVWKTSKAMKTVDMFPKYHSISGDGHGYDCMGGPVERRLREFDWITWDKFETDYLNKKIMSKREIYEAMLKKWVELNDLKVGDTVRIVKEFVSGDGGDHTINFSPYMSKFVGTTGKVTDIFKSYSICIDGNYYWDYRSLEKVENVPVFYKTGDAFSRKDCEDTYILVTNSTTACLANMKTGYTWNGFKQLPDTSLIKQKEFTSVFGTDFTKIE